MSSQFVNKVNLSIDPQNTIKNLPQIQQDEFQIFANRYKFPLDNFQQYSIIGLLLGDNVLVTVPTSCGKTIVAEFAIWYCFQHNKRVIYTSPIKTLSNQKYSEFQEKFDHSKIGIITGDVKFNPEADCLIMTTEILRDLLFKGNELMTNVGMVIFDEVHYINNDDRGHVWEQCLMLLPSQIQLIMLSATISQPELFASWISNIKNKPTHLMVHNIRPVPLVNYLYSVSPIGKLDSFFVDKKFNVQTYNQYFKQFQLQPKKSETALINNLVNYLKQQELCPALFFTFSRKKCEQLATCLVVNFHTTQEQTEIERTINNLLSRYQYDYNSLKMLPQIIKLIDLAKKGIAFHHSGLLSFSKEIIEILFSRGFIKIMFVTETFSVGINMPTRTVVFSDLSKNVNGKFRQLYTDEYYQMAGRAGRRGLDTRGCVIYFPIQRMLTTNEIRSIVEGEPMSIRSRYQVDYHIILQQLNFDQPYEIVEQSYLFQELKRFTNQISVQLESTNQELETIIQKIEDIRQQSSNEQINLLNEFNLLQEDQKLSEHQELLGGKFNIKLDNKQQRQLKNKREQFKSKFKTLNMTSDNNLLPIYDQYLKLLPIKQKLLDNQIKYQNIIEDPDLHLRNKYKNTLQLLIKDELLTPSYTLTSHGKIAAMINNADAILLTSMLKRGMLNDLDLISLGLILSLLTSELNGQYQMTLESTELLYDDPILKRLISQTKQLAIDLIDIYPHYIEPDLPVDLLEATYYWLKGESFVTIAPKIDGLQGNFVRSMLRLLKLSEELIDAFVTVGLYLSIEVKLRELIMLINRDIIVFDSIYIKGL